MSNGWSLQQHVSAVEGHMSYNQLWLLKVLQHLKWEEKLGFRPFDNTFVSVLQCSTEAFHCVQSARKEVVWVWIEGDIENVLPLLLVCFNELQTRKRENRQHNRKVAEYVLILILPPPPPFFFPFWVLFGVLTLHGIHIQMGLLILIFHWRFTLFSSLTRFDNMSGLQSAFHVFYNKTIALVLSWFLSWTMRMPLDLLQNWVIGAVILPCAQRLSQPFLFLCRIQQGDISCRTYPVNSNWGRLQPQRPPFL